MQFSPGSVFPENFIIMDKFYVLKTTSTDDRGYLFSETISFGCMFCWLHQLKIDEMAVFDNLFLHPYYRKVAEWHSG